MEKILKAFVVTTTSESGPIIKVHADFWIVENGDLVLYTLYNRDIEKVSQFNKEMWVSVSKVESIKP